MKFDYKRAPLARDVAKQLPKDAQEVQAFKVRPRGETEPVGTVVGFGYGDEGAEGWVYIREGKVYGGFTTRYDASLKLATA